MVEMQGEFQSTFRPVGELPQRHPDPAGMITANSKIFSLNSSNFVSDVIWMRFGWMAWRYSPSSLLQTFFTLVFGVDLFGSYALHCRPSDITPGNCFFQKFCYQHAHECITNEKTGLFPWEYHVVWIGKKSLQAKKVYFNVVPVMSSP